MAKKTGMNVYVHPAIAIRLRETAAKYDGKLGDCLAAGILLFLEAAPQEQAAAMQRVYAASLTDGVEALLQDLRDEQTRRALTTPARPSTSAMAHKGRAGS